MARRESNTEFEMARHAALIATTTTTTNTDAFAESHFKSRPHFARSTFHSQRLARPGRSQLRVNEWFFFLFYRVSNANALEFGHLLASSCQVKTTFCTHHVSQPKVKFDTVSQSHVD